MGVDAAQPGQIGRYRIESVLGRGAMGVIYLAHDPAIDRKVAIKLVRADLLEGADRTEYIARFQQEAQAAGRCSHTNIVAIYDFALHEGNPYLAMEYIDGLTLGQMPSRPGGFDIAEVIDLASQILGGLGAAHALGVIHRDIKPANIMLTHRGQVKVTDFGIARLDTSQITGTGAVIGTPSYMSPEQCRGEPADGRSDLFSVGVVLYELLTGVKPFAGVSQHQVWHRLLHEEPADPATLRPDAPAPLLAAIRCALAKSPGARFASATDMLAALHGGQSSRAELIDPDRTVVAARAAAVPSGAPAGCFTLDSSLLSTIERQLAQHIGPIAGLLLKGAIRTSDTVETLCRTLAGALDRPTDRESFNQAIQVKLAGSLTRAGRSGDATLPEADLARAQKELTRYVGPVARVLVKRAAPACADLAQLWLLLADHVEGAADRAAFLQLL